MTARPEAQTDQHERLRLWDSVRTPDPSFTKPFKRTGGFNGTATSPLYLIRVATELWGPIGAQWSVTVEDERVIDGAPILDKDNRLLGLEKLHTVRVRLRYPQGESIGVGNTILVGSNKHGPFTDEEAPKKSLTDAVTKALSWIGFAADIHLGLWDDSKYVNEARKLYKSSRVAPQRVSAVEPADDGDDGSAVGGSDSAVQPAGDPGPLPWYQQHLEAINASTDGAQAQRAWDAAKKAARGRQDVDAYNALKAAAEAKSQSLAQAAAPTPTPNPKA
jgi:hypothetical protein